MVQCQLLTNSVRRPDVLAAFASVPREVFVPARFMGVAYRDEEIETGPGRHLLAPVSHARLVEETAPSQDDVVLDVGFGSGYSPAIWSTLVTTVIAIDDLRTNFNLAQEHWERLEIFNVVAFHRRLAEGCPDHAPYDIIFLNGAVAEPPKVLLGQLAPGGRLATVIRTPGSPTGRATVFCRSENGHVSPRTLFDVSTQYLPGFEPASAFSF